MIINILCLSLVIFQITYSWQLVPSPIPIYQAFIGSNSNSNVVWMLQENHLISFDKTTEMFVDHGSILPAGFQNWGTLYAQTDDILYAGGVSIFQFDLTTSTATPQNVQHVTNTPISWPVYGCISVVDHYIVAIQSAETAIYDINSNTWTMNGPIMQRTRGQMTCVVTDSRYLYVFGGYAEGSIEKLYVGDMSNINSYSWTTLSATLSPPNTYATSVVYKDFIFVIGGITDVNWPERASLDTVDVINTYSDIVFPAPSLNEPLYQVVPIIIGTTIYAFGGKNGSYDTGDGKKQSYYQTYELEKYIIGPSKLDWSSAKQYCESIGSELASIHSSADQLAAELACATDYQTDNCWIGLHDSVTEGTWIWTDNTPVDYGFNNNDATSPTRGISPWDDNLTGQPDNSEGQDCVYISIRFTWEDGDCSDSYYPICNQPVPGNPSKSPTESPIHPVCTVEELDWDALITDGVSQTSLSLPSILSSWDAATLQFSIDITLDYITRSKYTFVDQYDNDRGVTYVIDTQPFLSDGRLLSNPNNCENRAASSFASKNWNTEYWSYLDETNGLNSENYLEYGPTNIWTLNWDIECETITYSNIFSFNQLLGCTDKNDINTFIFIEDANWLNLTGAFYITLVSPLINQNDIAQSSIDIGQYLTKTIGNYPISISFPKTIASIRDPGVILFDISIFAIQYDEENSKLLVDILSYTAQYINLINVNVIIPIISYDTNGVVNSITINEDDSYSTRECLFETNFRCFQKFQIEIDLLSCPLTSIDLSTTILLDVEPTCRNGKDCTLFRSEFGAIGTTTQLTESLSYTESCDTQIYIQTFEGRIKYFIDMGFTNEVDETNEFSIGSTLYVDVSVNDIGAYGVFSINVLNVWICTTSANDLDITSQLSGEGGCIQNYASNNAQASNIDEIYQAFKDGLAYDSQLNGEIYESINDESVRFSLIIPSFQRNKFWLHAIVEMTFENNIRRRARLLLTNSNNGNTVNRLAHYIKHVSIVNDIIKTTHSVNNTEKEQTDSSVSHYYYSYFVYIISAFIIAFC